jgi:hypothetical protein
MPVARHPVRWISANAGPPADQPPAALPHQGGAQLAIGKNDAPSAAKEADDDKLKEVSWEEFFQVFDESDLSFLYSEETAEGQTSRFFKFVREE